MRRARLIVAGLAAGLMLAVLGASPASSAPEMGTQALVPVNCSSNPGAIRVNVPYYPNTYCYSGIGQRNVNLTQVWSVQSGNWTMSMYYRRSGESQVRFTSLVSGKTFYVFGGTVLTITVP